MTDKKIDRVDIMDCFWFEGTINHNCNLYQNIFGCNKTCREVDIKNCIVKQFKKKEQGCEKLKEENEELKAQRDTYANLMNVYKNISKSRQDSEIVIDYIDKLEKKLKIAEEALNDIKNSFFEDEDKEIITHAESIYYYSKAKEALQKMKEVQND